FSFLTPFPSLPKGRVFFCVKLFAQDTKRAWDKNHFGFLFRAQNLINGGNRTNSFGNKPKFSQN
ncbi:hypothetical protein QP206_26460, partial [Escherichia coli]|nr:hypothetical protein [Escherichia coli]